MSTAIPPRWYMLNNIGFATLCADKKEAEIEASDANMCFPHSAPHRAVQLVDVAERDELTARLEAGKTVWRQDQARIAELMTQRDELLKALKEIATTYHGGNKFQKIARAAIAKHQPPAAPAASKS